MFGWPWLVDLAICEIVRVTPSLSEITTEHCLSNETVNNYSAPNFQKRNRV